jgi:ketosteroid isomerase-like protein
MAEGSVKEQVGDLVTRAKRRVGVEQPSAADDDGHVGIVRGALRAFGEGDMDAFLDALKHDVVWEGPDSGHFPGGGEQLGRDAVKSEFIDNAERTFTNFGFRPESFVDADDVNAVIVIGCFEGDGVEGERLDEDAVQIWEFEGNAVSRVRIYTDSAGFPPVITERREKELEEKEREEKEKEEQKDSDDSDSDSSEAKSEKKDETEASSEEKHSDDDDDSDDEKGEGESKDSGDDERRNGNSG